MINSIAKQKSFMTPEKAASFIPIFISVGISILIISFFVIPKYIKSTKVNLELNGFEFLNNIINPELDFYKVSTEVNKPNNNDNTLIKPA